MLLANDEAWDFGNRTYSGYSIVIVLFQLCYVNNYDYLKQVSYKWSWNIDYENSSKQSKYKVFTVDNIKGFF